MYDGSRVRPRRSAICRMAEVQKRHLCHQRWPADGDQALARPRGGSRSVLHEGTGADEDLRAVVDGIKFVRAISADLRKEKLIAKEELPGDEVQSDEDLKQFVRNNAW